MKRKKNNIFKGIGKFFANKINKFKELPIKIRQIICLWTCIIILLIIIICASNVNNSNIRKYTNVEKDIQKAAIEYVEDKELAAIDSQKIRLDMDFLLKSKYLKIENKEIKDCIGYALVYTNDEEEVKAKGYLSCKGYTTSGFTLE